MQNEIYVILENEYFDESQVDTTVIGYFKSEEDAINHLINNGYEPYISDLSEILGDYSVTYQKECEFEYTTYDATIEKLGVINR